MRDADALAVPPGSDAVTLSRALAGLHDEFLETGRIAATVRPVVAESWRRSLVGGLDPETGGMPDPLGTAALEEQRRRSPLARTMPLIRRLLVEAATDAGLVVAVSDAAGQLLWVEGNRGLRTQAEAMQLRGRRRLERGERRHERSRHGAAHRTRCPDPRTRAPDAARHAVELHRRPDPGPGHPRGARRARRHRRTRRGRAADARPGAGHRRRGRGRGADRPAARPGPAGLDPTSVHAVPARGAGPVAPRCSNVAVARRCCPCGTARSCCCCPSTGRASAARSSRRPCRSTGSRR